MYSEYDISEIFDFVLGADYKKPKENSNVEHREDVDVLSIDLPGYKKENILVEASSDILKISFKGSRGDETRKYKLTDKADFKNITSTFEDGVLVVNIPYKAELKPIKIEVK